MSDGHCHRRCPLERSSKIREHTDDEVLHLPLPHKKAFLQTLLAAAAEVWWTTYPSCIHQPCDWLLCLLLCPSVQRLCHSVKVCATVAFLCQLTFQLRDLTLHHVHCLNNLLLGSHGSKRCSPSLNFPAISHSQSNEAPPGNGGDFVQNCVPPVELTGSATMNFFIATRHESVKLKSMQTE